MVFYIFALLEHYKLPFKRRLISNKNQLECQGRSALLLSVQFTLDKTAAFLLFRNSVEIHYCHFAPDFSPVPNRHSHFLYLQKLPDKGLLTWCTGLLSLFVIIKGTP